MTQCEKISHTTLTELQKCYSKSTIFLTRPAYYNIYHDDLLGLRRSPTSSLLKYLFVAIYFNIWTNSRLFAFIKYSKFETWTLLTGSLWRRSPQKNTRCKPSFRSTFRLRSQLKAVTDC